MSHERHLPMFVIDVLRYDIEQISNIVNLLNDTGGVGWRVFWRRDFDPYEVFVALTQVIALGYVTPLVESPKDQAIVDYDGEVASYEQAQHLWFRLTEQGWLAWHNWNDYPISDDDQPGSE